MRRKNKDVAGYQILYILAMVDGDFDPREGRVINDFIEQAFPLGGNLKSALEELLNMKADDYPILLQQCSEDFYADSIEKERIEFLDFALRIISADKNIDPDENWMINKLYQDWDIS